MESEKSDDQIQVTPEMIEAGAWECLGGFEPDIPGHPNEDEMALKIYLAMETVRRAS